MKRKIVYIVVGAAVISAAAVYVGLRTSEKSLDINQLSCEDQTLCHELGGEMIETGAGLAGSVCRCFKPHTDAGNDSYGEAGKKCTSSDECEGMCLYGMWGATGEGLPVPSEGECSRYDVLPNCIFSYELLGGGKYRQIGICDL